MPSGALSHIRVADFTGQLAGAGATRYLAAMGADVIRIEDPVRQGQWDLLRGGGPFKDDRAGINLGGAFNNHNVEKRGITINMKHPAGREVFERLVVTSDLVTENFAAGVLARLGYDYHRLRAIRPDIVYVSNCGFGHSGPYVEFKTWGPVVQALSGLTFSTGLPGMLPAGIGYSYMDHHGGNFMALAIMAALVARDRTGDGMWIDMASTEAGATLLGPALLDYTANGRPLRREGQPNSNRSTSPEMAPHGIYRATGDDEWIAIACRSDEDWERFAKVVGEPWAATERWRRLPGRLADEDELDQLVDSWTSRQNRFELAETLQSAGVAAVAVQRPGERIESDPNTSAWGLWPEVTHSEIGRVRVDGLPLHFSRQDWLIEEGAPCLGEHNDEVLCGLLGYTAEEVATLREERAI